MAKQAKLEGIQTSKIPAVQAKAIEYAEARDERLEIQRDREVPLKQELIALMHKHGLTEYGPVNGITVTLTPGEDTLKVKVSHDDE